MTDRNGHAERLGNAILAANSSGRLKTEGKKLIEQAQAAVDDDRKLKAIFKLACDLRIQTQCQDEKRWERIKATAAKIMEILK